MRRAFALIFLLGCTATIMAAQDTPKIELFGGYSFTHTKIGVFPESVNGNGWNVSVAYNLNKWFGIVVDGGGTYGSKELSPPVTIVFVCPVNQVCPPTINLTATTFHRKLHTYSIGPQFSYRTSSRFTPLAHALIGGGYDSDTTTFTGGHFTDANGAHVLTLGGGVDFRLTDRLAVRTQEDFLRSRFFSQTHGGFRLSSGLVFSFGKK